MDTIRAISFTHPDTIEKLRNLFIRELDRAEKSGRIVEFLESTQTKLTEVEIRKLTPEELYIAVVSSSSKLASNGIAEKMKNVIFEVIESKLIDDSNADVTLQSSSRGPNNRGRLILKKYNGRWMVVGNAP